ncbi:MAG: ribonuclease III [Chthoniobacterales bacterium]
MRKTTLIVASLLLSLTSSSWSDISSADKLQISSSATSTSNLNSHIEDLSRVTTSEYRWQRSRGTDCQRQHEGRAEQVRASQYCDFLNHVATERDPDHLYNEAMTSDPTTASIARMGVPGRWHYEVIADRENFPITYVNSLGEENYKTDMSCSLLNDDENADFSLKSNRRYFQNFLLNENVTLSLEASQAAEKSDSFFSKTAITEICLILAGGMMLKTGDGMIASGRGSSSALQRGVLLEEALSRSQASTLEQKIDYRFKNQALLNEALTHSSSLNEITFSRSSSNSNERLEFLGDTVLQLVVTEHLFDLFPNDHEGELTKKRATLISDSALQAHASDLRLAEHLIMGRGERMVRGDEKVSILANSFEALVGAIFRDGGMEAARAFILPSIEKHLNELPKEIETIVNPKGTLQELLQSHGLSIPNYELLDEHGADHAKQFRYAVFCEGKKLGEGEGNTKKEAQSLAAKKAVALLQEHVRKLEEPNERRVIEPISVGKKQPSMNNLDATTKNEPTKKRAKVSEPERSVSENFSFDEKVNVLKKSADYISPATVQTTCQNRNVMSFYDSKEDSQFINIPSPAEREIERSLSLYRNQATQAEAAGHSDQARCLNKAADFITKASTMKTEGRIEEATLWMKATQESVIAAKAFEIANKKGERPAEGGMLFGSAEEFLYLTADACDDVVSYSIKAAETKAAGNQRISNLWIKAAEELKKIIEVKEEAAPASSRSSLSDEQKRISRVPSAWNAAYRFATTVEYFTRAEDARMREDLELADLWTQAAMKSEVAAEKLSQLTEDILSRGHRSELVTKAARFSEHFARAAERTAWGIAARAEGNEELADLWAQAAKQANIVAENLIQAEEASKIGDNASSQRFGQIASQADTAADWFAQIANCLSKAAEARAFGYQTTADLWIRASEAAKCDMEEELQGKAVYYSSFFWQCKSAKESSKKEPPITLPIEKTKGPRKTFFAKYR